jgi:uncharacterized membrane protein HdeD (DUF308 family)
MATDEMSLRAAELRRSSQLHRRWGWLLFFGVVQIVGGVLAIAVPAAASIAAAIIFGAVILVAGAFQLAHAFSVRKWSGVALQALGGLLYIAAGIVVLLFPVAGALTLAVVVAVLLIADGVVRIMLSSRLDRQEGRGWLIAAGVASALLGILLLIGWPLTGIWAIGILLGVNLLFSGAANCALAIGFRSLGAHELHHEPFARA